MRASSTSLPQLPQIVPESRAVTSSVKPKRLADFAQRAFRAVMDDGGDNPGAVAAIALIDILHHLLAPLMFEIDVDVGRLGAFFGQEAGKEQIVADRIDRGDAEQIADQRIGRTAASLAQYRRVLRAGDI